MSDDKKPILGRIRLEGVRLSFADLWITKTFTRDDGTESPPRRSANFLIPKDGDLTATYKGQRGPIMAMLKRAKMEVLAEKMGAEKAADFKIRPGNYCVKDGDDENYDGYPGHWFVSSANSKPVQPNTQGGIKLIGRDRRPLVESDGILYSGCYVNAIVTLWYQPAGKKKGQDVPHAVYATLEAVQFLRKGAAFGAPEVDVDTEFDDETDESDFADPDAGADGEDGVL